MNRVRNQFGAVSLFIVIFSALLMTVVTLSFVTLMVTNQQQSSASDLSKSALDSAQAGIEDAKRALLVYESQCIAADATTPACTTAAADMNTCNAVFADLGIQGATGQVGNGTNDNSYNQAYSCVKILLNTPNYQGSLEADGSTVIPLTSSGVFNTVQLQWYSQTDLQGGTSVSLPLPSASAALPLAGTKANEWSINRPSLMRAQLIQYASAGFTLADTDNDGPNGSNQSDNGTLFLYPVSGAASVSTVASFYTARPSANTSTDIAPTDVTCNSNLSGGGYACTAELTMPAGGPVTTPGEGSDAISFLHLSALYNATSFTVTLRNTITPATPSTTDSVDFAGVQPEIDSTGSASDLYKRLVDRVSFASNLPIPDAEVETTGGVCKDFLVTNNPTDYANSIAANSSKCKP